jgi:hypothetical protein
LASGLHIRYPGNRPRDHDVQNRPTLIEQGAALHISSRITGEDLDVLRIALEEGRVVALDFAEVKLAMMP